MFGSYSPAGGPGKDLPRIARAPQPKTTLYERLDGVLGQRDIVVVGTWIDDARGFEPEPIYVVRGSVIDKALNDEQDWGLVYERFSAEINIVPGTVLAASATVRA